MNNQVEEIKAKIDIAIIIGERIELKKAGRNFKANCPFHGEKTPSLMVSPELSIFKCFGCGEGGDVFNFLEKFEGMDFPEALKYLADRAGVKLERVNFGENSEKEKLIEINTQASRFYNYLLTKHALGKEALEYLLKERGIKEETIEEFQIGFAPNDPQMFRQFLVGKKKFDPKDLEKVGLGIVRNGALYDRFSGRVIFPLFDHRGNPVGFSGRILPWDKRETGKYINSPETPLYHKSNILFGLNITRTFIKKKKIAIVMEGELDAISSYQAGIKNVVAIKGSSLTEEQVKLLSRFAEKFVLALDADLAGDAAARRGIAIAQNSGVEVKVATLTKYKDPDDAVRNDLLSFKKDLIASVGAWDFLINSIFSRYSKEEGSGKAKISKEVIPLLSSIGDNIVQAHYINLVAQKMGIPSEAVTAEIKKTQKGESVNSENLTPEKPKEAGRRGRLEERFLTLAFQSDPKILLTGEMKDVVISPFGTRLVEEYDKYSRSNTMFSVEDFGKNLPKELFEGFAEIMMEDNENLMMDPDELKKELDLVKKELKILEVKENLKKIAQEMRDLEEKGENTQLLKAQNKFNKLAATLSAYEESEEGSIILNKE